MLEWINDDSFENLWANKFDLKGDKIEEEDSFKVSKYFNERVSFPSDNEDDIRKMTNRIDALSNIEWMEDDVFEDYWAMGVMFSDHEDNERAMQVMNEIEVIRNRRNVHGSNQLEKYYCKFSKELSWVLRKIAINLCTSRIIWDPGGLLKEWITMLK